MYTPFCHFFTQPPSLSYILEANALKPLCDLLVVKDAKIVQVLLDGLLNILILFNPQLLAGRLLPKH